MILPETEIWIVSGNINIIQVVDVAGNGNMVRIGKYYRKWKYCRNRKYCRKRKYWQNRKYYRNRKIIPETEILNICSKRKLIPESEILNIVRIGNEFRNREFNRKRIVRISIGRGLPDEGPARSQAIAQQVRGLETPQAKAATRPTARQAQRAPRPRIRGPCCVGCSSHAWAVLVAAVCVWVCAHAWFLNLQESVYD